MKRSTLISLDVVNHLSSTSDGQSRGVRSKLRSKFFKNKIRSCALMHRVSSRKCHKHICIWVPDSWKPRRLMCQH
eukprot:m.1647101 g.1647101  ORF g.1647101 m.1647101 type:complete len:75 (-) comp74050_c0_seq1:46-270(-)